MKLGSLFDGSGGFPLAGSLCGIEPVWAAEVEPYPIAVTKSRFPKMKHLGNICNINGAEIEPVDIITFGSPCQDLSVAGKRAGLKHEDNGDEETTRSGLFMEAVRIIKEMRSATNGRYPTFALWENVPGAFSSNQGEDFRIVLEELIKIVEPTAKVPAPPKGGWPYADIYLGDGWSLAYRVFDAQYWGVPQRRRRIHLVADFRGGRAGEVLFKSEGLRGYFAESGEAWQGSAGNAQNCAGATDREGESTGGDGGRQLDAVAYTLKVRSGVPVDSSGKAAGKGALVQVDKTTALAATQDQYLFQPVTAIVDSIGGQAERGWVGEIAPTLKATHYKCAPCVAVPVAGFCTEHSAQAGGIGYQEEVLPTLRAGVTPALVYSIENHPADSRVDIDESGKVQTLTSRMDTGGGNVPMVMERKVYESHPMDSRITELDGVSPTVSAKWHKGTADTPLVCEGTPVYRLQGNGIDRADTAGCNGKGVKEDVCYTLNTIDRPAVVYAVDQGGGKSGANVREGVSPTLTCTHGGEPAVAYGTDVGFFNSLKEQSPTLLARSYKDPHLVTYPKDSVRYIVRRLTPTECARLQGFPDKWGHPDPKTELTDEEYAFWTEVRATHAVINGKEPKTYGREQILKWYNGLHNDSAEYKMWGNGIALPPALYCMQGMAEALELEEHND